MGFGAWAKLFRIKDLPAAPGEALAGAAVAVAAAGAASRPSAVIGAGAAALLLHMYGMADSDTLRPADSACVSARAARVVRSVSWGAALLIAALTGLPPAWWLIAGFLLITTLLSNRRNSVLLAGLCRALSVISGAAAVMPRSAAWNDWPIVPLVITALGLAAYHVVAMKLAEGKDEPSEGLGNRRYLFGLAAFTALPAAFLLPDIRLALLPCAGCVFAFAAWCAAVGPLWQAHEPSDRQIAVERAFAAVLYLQIGFILCKPDPLFLGSACAIWLASRMLRRLSSF